MMTIQYLHKRPGIVSPLFWIIPWWWHPGAETCRSFIFASECILLSAWVGYCINNKHSCFDMPHTLTKLLLMRSLCFVLVVHCRSDSPHTSLCRRVLPTETDGPTYWTASVSVSVLATRRNNKRSTSSCLKVQRKVVALKSRVFQHRSQAKRIGGTVECVCLCRCNLQLSGMFV